MKMIVGTIKKLIKKIKKNLEALFPCEKLFLFCLQGQKKMHLLYSIKAQPIKKDFLTKRKDL